MSPEDPEGAALKLLGLARRAGALEAGVAAARQAVQSGTSRLVLTAADASSGQLDKVRRVAERKAVPVRVLGTRVGLGRAVGGPPTAAVAVTDEGLAEQVLRRITGPDAGRGEPK